MKITIKLAVIGLAVSISGVDPVFAGPCCSCLRDSNRVAPEPIQQEQRRFVDRATYVENITDSDVPLGHEAKKEKTQSLLEFECVAAPVEFKPSIVPPTPRLRPIQAQSSRQWASLSDDVLSVPPLSVMDSKFKAFEIDGIYVPVSVQCTVSPTPISRSRSSRICRLQPRNEFLNIPGQGRMDGSIYYIEEETEADLNPEKKYETEMSGIEKFCIQKCTGADVVEFVLE